MIPLCLGLSHRSASLELRERLCRAVARQTPLTPPAESVVLATCNRLEIYAAGGLADPLALMAWLESVTGLAAADFRAGLYVHAGRAALQHLCRVAAGLDSLIPGEPQIRLQVKHAYETARRLGCPGPLWARWFRLAAEVSKRVHAETGIDRLAASVSSVAVALAQNLLDDLAARPALLVGAGQMAGLAARALRSCGVRNLTVTNRTFERAAQLAQTWGARAVAWECLPEMLADAELVLTFSGAPERLITAAQLEDRVRPLLILDLAMPRNVEPQAKACPAVRYYDLDDLRASGQALAARLAPELVQAEAIVSQATQIFMEAPAGSGSAEKPRPPREAWFLSPPQHVA